jgi:type VI secretion system protein ImpA
MPLRNDLLNPISADNPSGENLRYAPIYDKIKEARREDDDAPQGEWARERKVADWALTVKLISDTLATKTKDLQLVAWLTEAMVHREGISGLQESLQLVRSYLENFWDTVYPELEDGDAEMRATPLQWIGDRLEIALKQAPLTKKGKDWFKYKESRAVGTEEAAAESDTKRAARAQAIAEGKLTQEEFDAEFDETPKKFYVDLEAKIDATLEILQGLADLSEEKFGDVAPSYSKLKGTLEELHQTAHVLLQKKREKEPDEPSPDAEPEPEPEIVVEEEPVVTSSGSAAAAAPARKVARGALAAEPADREDAVERVVVVARYLRQQEPYNPAPYLLLRGLRWGELRASSYGIDALLLAAPPTEIRQNLKRQALEGNWQEALETAETAMGMECGRGWLDLQRYVARACYELGGDYSPIRAAVISSLRSLLMDYPDLPAMTMMDDTATANAETLAWFREEVTPPPPEPAAAEPEPEPVYAPPAWEQQATPGEPAPPDAFELAMQAAQRGRPQEGIEILMRELAQERSGRARFQRKAQLAQLCVSSGHEGIALPILQELAGEIERRRLEDWEAADLIAHPLALLYRSIGSDAPPEERQKLYSWICRLDPLQALNVAR